MQPDSRTVQSLLKNARVQLSENSNLSHSESIGLDTQLLLAHCLQKPRSWLIGHAEDIVDNESRANFKQLITRKMAGEPTAYLLGYKDFWNHRLKVSSSTLIPRPETELLIEIILSKFLTEPRTVLDLGTGSGAIAITLAAERPAWHVIATDNSPLAIEIAKQNAMKLPNISFLQGHWASMIRDSSVDLIVCNPPYIDSGDPHLAQLKFEPLSALVAEDNGYKDLNHVIHQASSALTNSGHLLLEHGFEQQLQVTDKLQEANFTVELFRDIQNQPRAVLAHKC